MTEDEYERVVALIQEAALGLSPWSKVGEAVARLVDATRVVLRIGPMDGSNSIDLIHDTPGCIDPVAQHYRKLDPTLPVGRAIAEHRLDLRLVANIFEMIPERDFRSTEYYNDYARHAGLYYRLSFSGFRDGRQLAPFRVYRPEDAPPFDEAQRATMLRIKPHVKHALAVRERLQLSEQAAGMGYAALHARPEAILVVDGDMRLVFANCAAENLLARADTLSLAQRGEGPRAPAHLTALGATDTASLERLVRAVAVTGASGGAYRLRPLGAGGTPGLALTVSPLPSRLLDGSRMSGPASGLAMIVVIELRRAAVPSTSMLKELFGLSRAEAAVAAALASGGTAEQIAQTRRVTPETVRSQIRLILTKVGANGLRDLERILAKLPSDA